MQMDGAGTKRKVNGSVSTSEEKKIKNAVFVIEKTKDFVFPLRTYHTIPTQKNELAGNDLGDKDFNLGTSIVFSLSEEVGVLVDALTIFKNRHVNLKHIESRPSKTNLVDYDFYVDVDESSTKEENIKLVIEDLKSKAKKVAIHHNESIPWFPRKISDLDKVASRVLDGGSELEADHPGFTDKVYRARRKEFADIAIKYRHGDPLPNVEYTEKEIETWNTVFTELTKLYPTHACRELNSIWPLLVENCGYRIGNIPQLREVSKFLKERTGFTLRPISGLLSFRDFLASLAFRVFNSTQYIRHHDKPMFTPEPDVVHELIGHVPLFADPSFAQFSQEIGLASLGASDELIDKLTSLFWYTVEFGLCRQNNEVRAYGAGLLSSFGELKHCIEMSDKHRPFEPEKVVASEVPVTEYQHQYFVAESFEDAKLKVRTWTQKIDRPFEVRYNPYTECLETLDDKDKITKVVMGLRSDIDSVTNALLKIH